MVRHHIDQLFARSFDVAEGLACDADGRSKEKQ